MQNSKTKYVDGYLMVVPKNRVDEYRKMAAEAAEMWLKHGALAVRECMGNDLAPDMGQPSPLQFSKLMNISEDETVWFSYIEYVSREDRDRVNALVHAGMDEYNEKHPEQKDNTPFDMKRMAFGGFTAEVSE